MTLTWEGLFSDHVRDADELLRVLLRLGVASFLGGLIGFERMREGKEAGLRTHMLVALGAALFVVVGQEAKMGEASLSRIIQGLAAGIGFLGAGTILKLSEEHRIQGLTTAASIWVTAAVGTAVGAGWLWPSFVSVCLAWIILFGLHKAELRLGLKHRQPGTQEEHPARSKDL